jgi:hypothetical protein
MQEELDKERATKQLEAEFQAQTTQTQQNTKS